MVPSYFGWELVVWKPMEEQFRAQLEGKPSVIFGEVHEVVEVGEETSEEGKIEMNLGTGDVPVHEVGVVVLFLRIIQGTRLKKRVKST